MDPGFDLLAHIAEPGARIHRKVAQQLEHRQRVQADVVRQVAGLGVAGQAGTTVDDHAAGAADAGAATEVKLQGGVLLFADHIQGDEERHAGVLFKLECLHMWRGMRIQRIEAEDLEGKITSHYALLP